MDPIIAQNLLAKARAAQNGEGGSSVDQAANVAKDMLKKEVKRQIWLWLLPILGTILPWVLLVMLIFFIWYAGCTNMGGTAKGWFLSTIMEGMGMCPF